MSKWLSILSSRILEEIFLIFRRAMIFVLGSLAYPTIVFGGPDGFPLEILGFWDWKEHVVLKDGQVLRDEDGSLISEVNLDWCATEYHRIEVDEEFSRLDFYFFTQDEAGRDAFVQDNLHSYIILRHSVNSVDLRRIWVDYGGGQRPGFEWTMILLDSDTYCWRRQDWDPSACTVNVGRCGGRPVAKLENGDADTSRD